MSQLPLPLGWKQEYDPIQKHSFWVDTTATPPRAIWVHPYEDEQFLSDHPDIKENIEKLHGAPLLDPPPYSKRRHSISGGESGVAFNKVSDSSGTPGTPSNDEHHEERKRGVFAKLKDKTIGTKEEREAHKKQKEEEREAHKKQKEVEREAYRKRKAEERARQEEELIQARRRNLEERAAYMRQYGGGYPPYGTSYDGQYGGQYGPPAGDPYAYNSRRMRGTGSGSGMMMPLVGGLAGGLLLGELLGGGFDGGFGGGGGGFF